MGRKKSSSASSSNSKKGKGRPSIYDPKRYPIIAAAFMRKDSTIAELARAFDVQVSTIYAWREKYPDFSEALKESKKNADAEVEASLFMLTRDRRVTETKKIFRRDKETGEPVQVGVEQLERVIPANLSAILVWLFNRTGDWKRNPDDSNSDPSKDPLYRMLAEIRDKKTQAATAEEDIEQDVESNIIPEAD